MVCGPAGRFMTTREICWWEEVAANGSRFRFTYDGIGPFARCVRTEGDECLLYRDLIYDVDAGTTYVGYLNDAPTRHDWLPDGTVWRTVVEPGSRDPHAARRAAQLLPSSRPLMAGPSGSATTTQRGPSLWSIRAALYSVSRKMRTANPV